MHTRKKKKPLQIQIKISNIKKKSDESRDKFENLQYIRFNARGSLKYIR